MIRIDPHKLLSEFNFIKISDNIYQTDFIKLNITEDNISDTVTIIATDMSSNKEIFNIININEDEFKNSLDMAIYFNNVIAKRGSDFLFNYIKED